MKPFFIFWPKAVAVCCDTDIAEHHAVPVVFSQAILVVAVVLRLPTFVAVNFVFFAHCIPLLNPFLELLIVAVANPLPRGFKGASKGLVKGLQRGYSTPCQGVFYA